MTLKSLKISTKGFLACKSFFFLHITFFVQVTFRFRVATTIYSYCLSKTRYWSLSKHGMIVAKALEIQLQVTFSSTQIIIDPIPTKTKSIVIKSSGNEILCEVIIKGSHVINGVKWLSLAN